MERYTNTIDFILHSYKVAVGKWGDRSGQEAAKCIGGLRALHNMLLYEDALSSEERSRIYELIAKAVRTVEL